MNHKYITMALQCYLQSFIILIMYIYKTEGNYEDTFTSYAEYYDLGMDAYKNGKWENCVSSFNNALKDYSIFRNTVIDCRLQCKLPAKNDEKESLEDMLYTVLIESKCLRKCKKLKFGPRPEEEISSGYEKKFQERQAYNYLQYCYFKNEDITNAASTAYTYYLTHQDDERILETLNYYKELPGVEEDDFQDLERKPYQRVYIESLMLYNNGDWEEAAESFELSLIEYFKEEERCRAYCEKGFVHTKYPDFMNAIAEYNKEVERCRSDCENSFVHTKYPDFINATCITVNSKFKASTCYNVTIKKSDANHYVMVVVCQQKCLQTLSTFGMDELENFVSEHYNYLQFSYYQAKNLKKAFESIASYLLFRPNDSEMLNNKQFYIDTLGHSEEEFVPAKMAVEYVELWRKLDKSISYIREEYLLPSDLVPDEEEEEEEGEDEEIDKDYNESKHYMAKFEKLGVKLFAESEELGGEGRFVADNLIRSDQCTCLSDPVKESKADELGIKSLGLSEMSELIKEYSDYEISLRLLMRAVTVMSVYTQAYFNKTGLFTKQVKVVCLPAGEHKLSEDCTLQEDGTCVNTLSSGAYRSVAYLTDITDGTGQMYFMEDDKNIQNHVSPKCGRLLGFKGDNQHGVNFSWKKERCAIVVDISENEEDLNIDVYKTQQLLKDLHESREIPQENVDNTDILNQFYSQGITISQTGKDLHGEERFVADGLSTDSECTELLELAKKEAVSGDGYRGNVSPHTDREIFSGLDISLAAKRGGIRGDGYDDAESTTGSRFVSPYAKNEHFDGVNISVVLEMVDSKLISTRSLQLLLDISEHGRLLTEKYFNLTLPLFFDFTHLVCRTAIEDEGEEEGEPDLSHPVHADNCVIYPNGSCIPDSSTFKQRHYSAVLYLNEDFKGGQFFFAHKNQSEDVLVQPKCGRIVAFNARDFHGVKAVRQGRRCAIAMWYTYDPNYYEVARINARRRLDSPTRNDRLKDKVLDKDGVVESIEEAILPPEVLTADFEKGHDEL